MKGAGGGSLHVYVQRVKTRRLKIVCLWQEMKVRFCNQSSELLFVFFFNFEN